MPPQAASGMLVQFFAGGWPLVRTGWQQRRAQKRAARAQRFVINCCQESIRRFGVLPTPFMHKGNVLKTFQQKKLAITVEALFVGSTLIIEVTSGEPSVDLHKVQRKLRALLYEYVVNYDADGRPCLVHPIRFRSIY